MSTDSEFLGHFGGVRESDLELMLSWRNDPGVRNNMYITSEISIEQHVAWWQRMTVDPSVKYFIYNYKDKPSGVVYFTGIDSVNHQSMWGFYSSQNAPKGTGSRMEFLALDYAFNELSLKKLSCEVLDYNPAVISLHKKFGFEVEGIFKQHHLYLGEYRDIFRLAILNDVWAARRQSMLEKLSAYL